MFVDLTNDEEEQISWTYTPGIFAREIAHLKCDIANLRIVKLLELILVHYLRVIGRQMVSHGSKWYQYCHGYGQCFATGPLLPLGIWAKWRLLFEVEKIQQLRLVYAALYQLIFICFWFLYKTRYLFKFVCFCFWQNVLEKIIPFTKATHNRIFNVAEYMQKIQLGSWRGEQKCKICSSGAISDYIPR
jgi:hypothetical protein